MGVINAKDKELWDSYVRTCDNLIEDKAQLVRQSTNLRQVIEYGFSQKRIFEALELMPALDVEERKTFFSIILAGASYQNRFTRKYEALVLSFPSEWLRENIERYAQPILAGEDKLEEYACLINLFYKIDRHLAIRLCQQAMESNDEEIRVLGRLNLQRFTNC